MTESNILKFAENEFFKETKKVRGEVEKFTNELKKCNFISEILNTQLQTKIGTTWQLGYLVIFHRSVSVPLLTVVKRE